MLSWSSAAPKLRTANNLSVSKTKLRETAGLHGWGGRLLGCLMYALSLNLFLAGNHIAAGGLGGVAVALTTIIPMRLSALVLIMNIPCWSWGGRSRAGALFATPSSVPWRILCWWRLPPTCPP